MKKYFALFVLLSISGFTLSLHAEGLSYTFISLNYGRFISKVDGVSKSLEGDGYAIDISYGIRPHVALTAGYSISIAKTNSADNEINADIDATVLGILIHFPINDTTDLLVEAGFINGKADVGINGADEKRVDADGGVVALGFRTMAYKDIEITGSLRKNSIEENTSISIDLAAGYYVHDTVSLDMGYRIDSKDGSDLLTFGITKYF